MTDSMDDQSELLFRQVHPNFIVNGELSSQPFQPSDKDEGRLSVDRESITTAENSHELYTSNGFSSEAVYALSVGEFANCEIPCSPDPLEAAGSLKANPAHAYADYTAHEKNKKKTIAKRLKNDALRRGRQHP